MSRMSIGKPAPSEPQSPTTVPERKDPLAPSTSHEYVNGDRGDKSGRNLEQQEVVGGTPDHHLDNNPGRHGHTRPTSIAQENPMKSSKPTPDTKPVDKSPPSGINNPRSDKSNGSAKPSSRRSARQGEKKSTP